VSHLLQSRSCSRMTHEHCRRITHEHCSHIHIPAAGPINIDKLQASGATTQGSLAADVS
jgi:hypothetical protein